MTMTGAGFHDQLFKLRQELADARALADRRLARVVRLKVELDAYKHALDRNAPGAARQLAHEFAEGET